MGVSSAHLGMKKRDRMVRKADHAETPGGIVSGQTVP